MTLAKLIRDEIASRGPIPFRDFMERALYHPEHGYYTSGRARIGRSGDFFTNVSVGPLFGAMLATQLEEMWERLGKAKRFTIVEQGAHDGRLAADILTRIAEQNSALALSAEYVIVEPSPSARKAQGEMLARFASRVRWVASPADLQPFTGVHLSNELLDAFPVHLVRRTGGEWVERHVDWNATHFAFVDGPFSSPKLATRLAHLGEVPADVQFEINLAALDWIAELAAKLDRGWVLAIDYGSALPPHDTLRAYSAHHRETDPLARPGEIDLTADVDLKSLADAATRSGLRFDGLTDQHHFMVALSQRHFGGVAPTGAELRAFKTLMHPELLGRSFKAICFSRGVESRAGLTGFRFT